MKVPSFKIYFSDEDIKFILEKTEDILRGKSFFSQAKYAEELEKIFVDYIGTKYAASTNSGTSALEVIFRALNIGGGEVIVPTNTFAATAFAVLGAGAKPVFADCGDDLTVDPRDVEKRITSKTKAICTVHIGGLVSPNTKRLVELCKEKGLFLIEDAAHAHGSSLDGKKAGSFGDASGFSFFSTKVVTSGEGGMITTNSQDIYEKAKVLRDQGKIQKGIYQNYHETLGYNWRMHEVLALMALTQMKHLENFIDRRNEIAKIYTEELSGLDKISILHVPKNVRSNYYKYIIFLNHNNPEKVRTDLYNRMKQEFNISMGGLVYEIPLHLQPVFKPFANARLPKSEDLSKRHICPPMFYTMTDEEAMYVAKSLKECLK